MPANYLNFNHYGPAIVNYVAQYIQYWNFSPSIEEITTGIGLKSKSSTFRYLQMLKERGQIKFVDRVPRSYSLPNQVVSFEKGVTNVTSK